MSKTTIVDATAALLLGAGIAAAQTQQEHPQQQPEAATGAQGQQMPGMGQMPEHGMMMRGDDDRGAMMMRGRMGHGMMRPHMMLMMMAMVDTDGSKTLSLEEVQAVHARMFAYADADSDGELTMEEMRAFMHGDRALQDE